MHNSWSLYAVVIVVLLIVVGISIFVAVDSCKHKPNKITE